MNEIDKAFKETLRSTASELAGPDAAELVTPPFEDALTDLITNLISQCFGGNDNTPAGVASQMKGMTPLQQSMLRNKTKRQYVKDGMTRRQGKLAADTLVTTCQKVPEADLTEVVAHVQQVDKSFPDLEMF
jgi:hypothetical protein